MVKKQTKTTKSKSVNKKHFMLYNNGGIISENIPKDWAMTHQELFNGFNFSNADKTPAVDVTENYLVNFGGFTRIANDELVIHYPNTNQILILFLNL